MPVDFEELALRRHEESVVKILLERYRIPEEAKWEMIDRHKIQTRRKDLVLEEFLNSFPTFPVHLDVAIIRRLGETCPVHRMFNNFVGLEVVKVFDRLVEETLNGMGPRRAGVVFNWPYVKDRNGDEGNLVIHDYTINVDVPGTRIFWVPENGRQLVVEPLDVLLESIDRDWPVGRGWQPHDWE